MKRLQSRVKRQQSRRKLTLEMLEGRRLLTTFSPETVPDLISAITTANGNGEADTIDLGGRTFTFTAPTIIDYRLNPGKDNYLPIVAADGGYPLTIMNGNLFGPGGVQSYSNRILAVAENAELTIINSSIAGGQSWGSLERYGSAYGGGILNHGTLTITDSTISGNRAFGPSINPASNPRRAYGGGIANFGTLSITGSTIAGNSVRGESDWWLDNVNIGQFRGGDAFGGGIANFGTMTVTDSTISGNRADGGWTTQRASGGSGAGGGIANFGTSTLKETTISGNQVRGASGSQGWPARYYCYTSYYCYDYPAGPGFSGGDADGGGIANRGKLTITGSTLAGNTTYGGPGGPGGAGGGVSGSSGRTGAAGIDNYSNPVGNPNTLTVTNTIITSRTEPDLANRLGNMTGSNNLSDGTVPGSIGAVTGLDPTLRDNGGPTRTHALLEGSNAINAGNNVLIPTGTDFDQRGVGFARIAGGTVDIGAFEYQQLATNAPPVVAANTPDVSANEGGTVSNTGTFSDPQGNNTVSTLTATVDGVAFGTLSSDPSGTWSWSADAGDGPDGPVTVTITATDDQNAAANTTFTYTVNNLPPTATLNAPISIVYGNSVNVSLTGGADASLVDAASLHYVFGYATTNASPLTNVAYVGSGTTAIDSFASLNAGTYWVFARVIDKDGDYSEYSQEVTVDKADATVTVTGYTGGTYDGNLHTQTVTVTGVGGDATLFTDNLSGTNAGSYSQAWSFTNDNYNASGESGTLAFDIEKADATVTVSGYSGIYDGAAHGATGYVEGVDAAFAALGSGLDLGDSFTSAPGGTAHWSFSGGTNYKDQIGTVAIDILQATLTGNATTQNALNMAQQGILRITISNVAGLVNGESLEDFLSSAEYYITIGATKYVFVPTIVTTSGSSLSIEYSIKDPALLAELGTDLDAATSGATALSAGFSMQSTNYTFTNDYLTRLFSTAN